MSSFKGKSPVVLFFYPKAGTPGCTKEACKFRDEYERFKKAGAEVFGISSGEAVCTCVCMFQCLHLFLISRQGRRQDAMPCRATP